MYCTQCGKSLNENAKFCTGCGNPTRPQQNGCKRQVTRKKRRFPAAACFILIAAIAIVGGGMAGRFLFGDKKEYPKCYTMNFEDVSNENGMLYVNNIVVVYFKDPPNTLQKRRAEKTVNGKIVAERRGVDQIQIRVAKTDFEGLNKLCEKLEQNKEILIATYDPIADTQMVPTDPWWDESTLAEAKKKPKEYPALKREKDLIWNRANPDGFNWWAEAIDLEGAWDCDHYFNEICMGIVDTTVNYDHPELRSALIRPTVTQKPSAEAHGTHVAGIIAAEHNNNTGISGVMKNVRLIQGDSEENVDDKNSFSDEEKDIIRMYRFIFEQEYEDDLGIYEAIQEIEDETERNVIFQYAGIIGNSAIYSFLEDCINRGAKVINMSLGILNDFKAYFKNTQLPEYVSKKSGTAAAVELSKLLETRIGTDRDFVIVQAAGNEGWDATDSGFFASMTADRVAQLQEDIKVNYDDIKDHVIIVGACDIPQNGEYTMAYFSNGGENVDIAAPGMNIYSTINDGCGMMSGTSMAAPMVTGVAGLVWSVNPDFTAKQVKDIVLTSVNKDIVVRNNPNSPRATGDFNLLNARLAVDKAIDLTYPSKVKYFDRVQEYQDHVYFSSRSIMPSEDENQIYLDFLKQDKEREAYGPEWGDNCFCIYKDKVYYHETTDRLSSLLPIYSCNLDGSDKKTVAENALVNRGCFVWNNWLYYIGSTEDADVIYRIDLETNQTETVVEDTGEVLMRGTDGLAISGADDRYLYYMDSDENTHRFQLDGGTDETLDYDVYRVYQIHDRVYQLRFMDGEFVCCLIKPDGSEERICKTHRLDYVGGRYLFTDNQIINVNCNFDNFSYETRTYSLDSLYADLIYCDNINLYYKIYTENKSTIYKKNILTGEVIYSE